MAVRAVKDKLKTSKSLPQVLSSCTLCNLVLGTEIGTRYRYIDDTPLVPLSEAGNSTNSSASANGTKTRSRPNDEYVLYSYGEPVGMTNDSGTSYFGTDILGSVRSVTDKYGAVQSDYSYDVFGSPYLGNLENDIGFGYCGKVYDNGTGLYDYGFRDYSPVSARFTTVDPIRDGANWFAYVLNDPVNYCDPFGLSSTDSSWWSNVKSTVKGWGESIKADLIQTCNDIKGVVSNALTNAKAVVSNFIANTQANLSNWSEQAKADFTQLGNDIETDIRKRINDVTDYKLINDFGDCHFLAFPENSNIEDIAPTDLLINSEILQSKFNIDGGYDFETGKGFKVSDGFSARIIKSYDSEGNIIWDVKYHNEVPKSHFILRMIVFMKKDCKKLENMKSIKEFEDWFSKPIVKEAFEIYDTYKNSKEQ